MAGEAGNSLGFETGVSEVGRSGFLNLETGRLGQHIQLNQLKHRADFGHLVGVATGDDQDRHSAGIGASHCPPMRCRFQLQLAKTESLAVISCSRPTVGRRLGPRLIGFQG